MARGALKHSPCFKCVLLQNTHMYIRTAWVPCAGVRGHDLRWNKSVAPSWTFEKVHLGFSASTVNSTSGDRHTLLSPMAFPAIVT